MRKNVVLSIAALSGLLVTGCLPLPGMLKSGTPQHQLDIGENPHAEELQKLAQQASCNTCHTGSGGRVPFADSTLSVAYKGLLQVISVGSPDSSRLLTKSQDGHYGGSAKMLAASDWSSLIKAFSDFEQSNASANNNAGNNTGNNNGNNTGSSALPAPQVISTGQELNPNANNNQVFTYNMPAKGSTSGTALTVQLTVRGMESNVYPNYARIGNISVRNNTGSPIKIEGIRIFLSASAGASHTADYDPARGSLYLKTDTTLAANGTYTDVRNTLFFNSPKRFVSVGFQIAEAVVAGGGGQPCQGAGLTAYTAFHNQVRNKCIGCHNGNGQGGYILSDNIATSCQSAAGRADTNNPAQSVILLKAYINPGEAHNGGKPMNAADQTVFLDWVRSFD